MFCSLTSPELLGPDADGSCGQRMSTHYSYSDTTAPTLTFLFYALAKYPEHQDMIFRETVGVDPFSSTAVASCEHLNAVIQETLRLWPAAATTVVRQAPPGGVYVGDTFVPGNTNLVAPRWTIFRRTLFLLT